MAQSKQYKEAMLEKYLKDSIITHAQALYGPQHPHGHNWSVVVEKAADTRLTTYRAHVIVYHQPKTLSEWTPLESTTEPCATEQEALEILLEDLQEGLAQMMKREYRYDSDTAVGSEVDGIEGIPEKHTNPEEDENADEESVDDTAEKSMEEDEEIFVDKSEDEDVYPGSLSRHDSITTIAKDNQQSEEETEDHVQDNVEDVGQEVEDEHSGNLAKTADERPSTDEERVEDLVRDSEWGEWEPPAKRIKIVRRRGFGGRWVCE